MSINVFRGGKFRPQSGGRLISNNLGRPNIFLPNSQVGYGFGSALKPIAKKLLTTLKGQARKIPGYLGRVVKRHGKKAVKQATKQVISGILTGKIKKGNRKQAAKRIAISNFKQAQQNIKKTIIKDITKPKRKMPKQQQQQQQKISRKRKPFYLAYRNKPAKRRRKDIFDK